MDVNNPMIPLAFLLIVAALWVLFEYGSIIIKAIITLVSIVIGAIIFYEFYVFLSQF